MNFRLHAVNECVLLYLYVSLFRDSNPEAGTSWLTMTSLAQQLQRLAVPHTQAVLGEDKQRLSLLFDPKEAANLDREAVFAIGLLSLNIDILSVL